MWKKWWDNLGNSWGGDSTIGTTNNPADTGEYVSITTTGTGLTYNEILRLQQQQMQQSQLAQQQQLQKQYQYQYQSVNVSVPTPRQYPFALDEDYILIEWARKRGDEFAHELVYKRQFAWSTAFPWSATTMGSGLAGIVNQTSPVFKYLKGKNP